MSFRLGTLFVAILGCHAAPVPPEEQQLTTHGRRAQSTKKLIQLLEPIARDPRAQAALNQLGTDERIFNLAVLVFDDEFADSLTALADVDVNELLEQGDMLLNTMGDMDIGDLITTIKGFAGEVDAGALIEQFQGADLSGLSADLGDMDLDSLASQLDSLDLDSFGSMDSIGGIPGFDDPMAKAQEGMEKLKKLVASFQAKMEDDPDLKAFLMDLVQNLVVLVDVHKDDGDQGVALRADLEDLLGEALDQYQEVENYSEEERLIVEEGVVALTEVVTNILAAAQDNIDVGQLAQWFMEFQTSAAAQQVSGLREQAQSWMWGGGQTEAASAAQQAIASLIPAPPSMSPYQAKQFEEVKHEAELRYEAHPDFKTMSNEEHSRWNMKMLADAQNSMSSFLTSAQLKQWASSAYHTSG